MKNRFTALLITVILVAGLFTACADTTGQTATTAPGQTTAAPTTGGQSTTAPADTTNEGIGSAKPEGEGTLRLATAVAASVLNPHNFINSNDSEIIQLITIRPYFPYPNADGTGTETWPEMAADKPTQADADGMVWHIPIRENLVWENGDPINVDDLIYSLQQLLNPALLNPRAAGVASDHVTIVNAMEYCLQKEDSPVAWEDVGIKRVDDYTLEVHVTEPASQEEIIRQFALTPTCIVHPATFEKAFIENGTKTAYGTDIDLVMACGKFKVESWVKGAQINLIKNPDFIHADMIYFQRLTSTVVKEASTRTQMFENGELDYVQLVGEDYKAYQEDPRLLTIPAGGVDYLTINTINPNQPIFANKNFREALFYAMNREDLAKLCNGLPANYILPQKMYADMENNVKFRPLEGSSAYLTENYGYNPEKAKELFELALQETGVSKVSFTLLYSEDEATRRIISERLQSTLPELFGADKIEIALQAMPAPQMRTQMQQYKTDPTAYEMGWWRYGHVESVTWNSPKVWLSTFELKVEPFESEEFDELWYKANRGPERFDIEKRTEYTQQMEKILLESYEIIPTVEVPTYALVGNAIELVVEDYIPTLGHAIMHAKLK